MAMLGLRPRLCRRRVTESLALLAAAALSLVLLATPVSAAADLCYQVSFT